MAQYVITQTSCILLNGHASDENVSTQRWNVERTADGHIVIDVTEHPQPLDGLEPRLARIIGLIGKVAGRIEFGFDAGDRLAVYNTEELKERCRKMKADVVAISGMDPDVAELLRGVEESFDHYETVLLSSPLYYTLWSWLGGGPTFVMPHDSTLAPGHHVEVTVRETGGSSCPTGNRLT